MSELQAPTEVGETPDITTAMASFRQTANYNRLLLASGAGNLADGIFKFGLPVLAVSLTGNKVLVSAVTAFLTLPWLLASLPAGALADRMDRLQIVVRANTFRTIVLALFAVGLAFKVESIVLVLLIALALGFAEVLFDTSAQAMIPNVVGDEMLGKANARLMTLEFSMNQLIGKALGGWLAGFAVWVAFGTAATAYFVAAIALMAIVGKFSPERTKAPEPYRVEIREGWQYLKTNRVLRNIAGQLAVMEFFYEGVLAVLPLFALATRNGALGLTASEYGLLIASMAIGGLAGSLVAHKIEERFHPIKAMTLCIITVMLQIAALAFTENIWIIGATTVLVGFGSLIFTVLSVTLRQRVIPDELLGRVNAMYRLAVFGAMSIGALAGGVIAQIIGLQPYFVLAFIAVTGVTLSLPRLVKPYNALTAVDLTTVDITETSTETDA